METLCGFLNSGGRLFLASRRRAKVQGQDFGDATFQEVANAIRRSNRPPESTKRGFPLREPRKS